VEAEEVLEAIEDCGEYLGLNTAVDVGVGSANATTSDKGTSVDKDVVDSNIDDL
jgi:hypothetical protein